MNSVSSFILSFFLLASSVLADASANIQTSNIACHIDAISSNPGFKGVFYQYSTSQTNQISNTAFYEGGYKTGKAVGTASSITDINFSVPGGKQNINGVNVDSSNFAIEYTGYFKGTFLFLLNIFVLKNILLTFTLFIYYSRL